MMDVFVRSSVYIVPIVILLVIFYATMKKIETYEIFVEGAKEGLQMALSILPFLLGMIVAIHMFRASGAMDMFVSLAAPIFEWLKIPEEVAPLTFIRSISGNASLGLVADLIHTYGPDSLIGRLAGTIQGSSDTTLYVITVYFGAVGIKKIGDALKVGLLADLLGIVTSVIFVYLIFY